MEALLAVVDKNTGVVDAIQAGDIIDVHPDGWPWTDTEKTNPDWRIVQVNVLQSTVDALLSADAPVQGKKARWRNWGIDVTLLPDPSLFIGARGQAIIPLTRAQVVAAAVKKP
jgi:hypothetical protein